MPLDPDLTGLLAATAKAPGLHTMSPSDARAVFRAMTVDARPPGSLNDVASVTDDEVAGGAGPRPARVYRPGEDGPHPTVVMFHGGGFVIGDLDTHDAMARSLCVGLDAVVVSVDYRLAPEHPFPAAAEDAIAAVHDIATRLGSYGGGPVLAVAGDSAGGNLSAVVAQQVPGLAAQLLVYPATDMAGSYASRVESAAGYFLETATMEWFVTQYLRSHDPSLDLTDPLLSPLHGDLTSAPPAVVVTAEFDPLRDEGAAYAGALKAAGIDVRHVPCAGLIHGFFDMGPWSPACQSAIDTSIAQFRALLPR